MSWSLAGLMLLPLQLSNAFSFLFYLVHSPANLIFVAAAWCFGSSKGKASCN
jgi:hypothetical protein